jgi:hypothetical protein
MTKFFVLLLFSFAPAAFAVVQPCNPETKLDCTVAEAKAFYKGVAKQAVSSAAAPVQNHVATDVTNTNRATIAPATFAARIHNSYEDYLNLFSFAINKVEESQNGQAVTIRFNPLRQGSFLAGGSLTVAEPSVADVVKNLIPEAQRDAGVAALRKKMSDTDDLTWTASASFATDKCPVESVSRCWGRSPRTYNDIISTILLPLIPHAPDDIADLELELVALFPSAPARIEGRKLSEIVKASDRSTALDLIRKEVGAEVASIPDTLALYRSHHLDLLPTLIDNQPQLSFSGSYHQAGTYGGPSDDGLSAEMHVGRQNINTMRANCAKEADLAGCLQRELDSYAANNLSTDKIVITATLKQTHSYLLTSLPVDPPISFEPLDLPHGNQFNLKGQIGRQLAAQPNTKATRVDASVEIVRNRQGQFLTQNRVVMIGTVSVPFMDSFTVPVSITYANKPEFLGDVNKHLGVHVGLTYRLPFQLLTK